MSMYAYWLANTGLTVHKLMGLITEGIGAEELYALQESQMKKIRVLDEKDVEKITQSRRHWDVQEHWGKLQGEGIGFVCVEEARYPQKLRRISATPYALYYLSEYPPGTLPLPGYFPQRNRIIAGLADYVIVMEARKKSGSLITADYAMEQGKEVYALPGRVTDALSEGTNHLIQQGAGIFVSVEDFLQELQLQPQNITTQIDFSVCFIRFLSGGSWNPDRKKSLWSGRNSAGFREAGTERVHSGDHSELLYKNNLDDIRSTKWQSIW